MRSPTRDGNPRHSWIPGANLQTVCSYGSKAWMQIAPPISRSHIFAWSPCRFLPERVAPSRFLGRYCQDRSGSRLNHWPPDLGAGLQSWPFPWCRPILLRPVGRSVGSGLDLPPRWRWRRQAVEPRPQLQACRLCPGSSHRRHPLHRHLPHRRSRRNLPHPLHRPLRRRLQILRRIERRPAILPRQTGQSPKPRSVIDGRSWVPPDAAWLIGDKLQTRPEVSA